MAHIQSKVNEIFVISLGPNREERLHSTQMFELSRLYGEIWPAKLTNHSAHTN